MAVVAQCEPLSHRAGSVSTFASRCHGSGSMIGSSRGRPHAARGTAGSHPACHRGRPRPGPGPGRRRGAQPPVHLVRHGHRQPGARHRARLRPGPPPPAHPNAAHPAHPARPAGRTRPAGHHSPSPQLISPGRPEDTAPGGSPPGSPGSGTCSCRSGRSPPANVITGTRPGAMIPGSCCGT